MLFTKYYSGDQISHNESGWARGTYGGRTGAGKVLVGTPEGNKPLERLIRRWEDNIKMDLQEVWWRSKDWIDLAK